LSGPIPEWNNAISNAAYTYFGNKNISGSIPKWNNIITNASNTYHECTALTGDIPLWNNTITNADQTYRNCKNISGTIGETDEELMPATISSHANTVIGCSSNIRSKFLENWGGTRTN